MRIILKIGFIVAFAGCSSIAPPTRVPTKDFGDRRPSSEANVDESALCNSLKTFLQKTTSAEETVDKLVDAIRVSNPEIIAIGELHSQSNEISNYYYPLFLEKLKASMPRLDCVAIEQDERQKATLLSEIKKQPIRSVSPDSMPWEYLLRRGAQLGMSIFAVDGEGAELSSDEKDEYLARNSFMAERLATLLKSKQCSKILTVNGMLHLWDEVRPSIPTKLSHNGFKTFKVGVIDLTEIKTFLDKGWFRGGIVWRNLDTSPVCKELPGALNENHGAIMTDVKIASSVPVLYPIPAGATWGDGRWSDFDGVLMVGCPSSPDGKCQSSNHGADVGYLKNSK